MNSNIKDQLTEWVCSPVVVVEDRRVIIHSHLVRWINTSSFNYHWLRSVLVLVSTIHVVLRLLLIAFSIPSITI